MKLAVTGATGFTGRRVVAELLRRGHEVRALVRPPSSRPGLPGGLQVVEGDMGSRRDLDALLEGAAGFVHVASLGFGQAEGIVAAVDAHRIGRSLFFSSTSLYTKLPSPSKGERLRAEERVQASAGEWTLLRPTMIYGDWGDRNLSRLIRFLASAPVVPLPGGGRALVQPVHVEDLGRAAVDALESASTCRRAYQVPGSLASPLRELVEFVQDLLGRRAPLLPLPIGPMAAVASLWHALGLPPRVTAEQVRRLAEDKAFGYEEARRDWGYAPRGWREGLRSELELLREAGRVR